ncbi:MAG: hypothetical protein HYY13_06520 [Nitrospirae bacterium]|nr:hypothetical protein [Nitrospirota bacterium]
MEAARESSLPVAHRPARVSKVVQLRERETPSIEKPFSPRLDDRVRICTERAELVTESYRRTEGQPWILRRALALDHLLRKMTIYILDGEQIVGNYASTPRSLPTYPEFSTAWLETLLDGELRGALDEKRKKRLKSIHEYWRTQNVEDTFRKSLPGDLKDYAGWTGAVAGAWDFPAGPMIPDYKRAFSLGLNGVLGEISHHRSRLSPHDPDVREKTHFYDAAEICARATIAFARRYAGLARARAETSRGASRKGYETVARICSRIPDHPPETFHEALQSFFFYHLISSQISWCSLGLGQRFDQLFYPFYRKEKDAGTLTYDRAVSLLEFVWIKLADLGQLTPPVTTMVLVGGTKFQNVTIGGVDEKGNDATNELSFAILDATMKARTIQPSLCLRYHEKINPRLVDKAIDCIATGIGMPAIFNDEVGVKWHLNMALNHMNSDALRYLGSKWPRIVWAFLEASRSRVARKTREFAAAVYPRTDEILHNWPYKVMVNKGRTARSLRGGLKRAGIFDTEQTLALIRDWSPIACVTGGLSGMSVHGGMSNLSAACVLSFVKCLEYVLYQGVERENGKQMGLRTPDPRTFRTYEQFLDAYLQQIRFAVEQIAKVYAVCEPIYQERMPRPFDSLLMKHAIARGRDATHKTEGAYSEILTMGPVNAADCLAVIKKLVFEEKTVSMDEMVQACSSNFEGREPLRQRCLKVAKFGNDDDYVDTLLAEMYRSANETVRSVKDHFGKPFALEAAVVGGFYMAGTVCGATPDGRKRGETLSDGQLSPMHGRDVKGPTAVLKSCSKVDPTRTWNQLLNQKFQPAFLTGRNKKVFADYLRTWHTFRNWHIQFNCVTSDTLRDAQLHPERHSGLIVRVSGYSAYFTDLTPTVQRDIIRRTEQDLTGIRCG